MKYNYLYDKWKVEEKLFDENHEHFIQFLNKISSENKGCETNYRPDQNLL